MIGKITYCTNSRCRFRDCERHLTHLEKARKAGETTVSVANFAGTCRRYLGFVLAEAERKERHGKRLS